MKKYRYANKKNLCGSQVRAHRMKLGITQNELAARLQLCGMPVDQKAVSRIELNDRIVADYELWALSHVLQVDMMQLLLPELELLKCIELPDFPGEHEEIE